MDRNTKIIAVAGKGGVGKTSISAAFVRLLTETYPESRILAIDADPAVGLSTALGVEVKATLDDIRKGIVQSVEMGAQREAIELLSEARFRIFDTMVEQQKFSFLAIGRPETAGCYCKVNAYLKEVINLLSHDFDYVVIADPSRKGTQVVDTIRKVADDLVMYDRCGVIVNRITDPSLIPYIHVENTEILSYIPADNAHAANDIQGLTVFDLPEDSPVMKGAREALTKMEIL